MSTNQFDSLDGVVVGFDGSHNAAVAVAWAAGEAQRRGAELHILSCGYYPGMPFLGAQDGGLLPRSLMEATEQVARDGRVIASKIMPEGAIQAHVVTSRAPEALIDASSRAALLVVGHRGQGAFASALLGSVADSVAQHAECPVVVVRGAVVEPESPLPVAVGVDGTSDSEPALLFAAQCAHRDHVPLRIVCAWQSLDQARWDLANWQVDSIEQWARELSSSARHAVDDARSLVRERWPELEVEAVVIEAPAIAALEGESRGSQLVVVGSHHPGAVGRLMLGSVSRSVLHHSACPVAVVRSAREEGSQTGT